MVNHPEISFIFTNINLSDAERQSLWPKRQSELASGLDLASASHESITIYPQERVLIPTGIALALPAGFEAQVRSRSGLSYKNGIVVINSPGTIDADYRGEIKVILANLSSEAFVVNFGMRIAQLVIAPVLLPQIVLQKSLPDSARGEAGFGSTGLGLLA